MCGIAGYKTSGAVESSVIRRMVGALIHRGPDAEGYYSSGPYTAGMRRLKINDLKTGDQPLFNHDRSVILLYNGEIYNSPALRKELESKGYRFKTHSDGEVICHMYDEYGPALFEKLDGMFAAALWVEKERRLILARDIPGEKPLYFARLSEKDIVFSSELKSIKLFPGLGLELDYQSIWDLPTFLWIPEPHTIYKSINALMPGHMLIADDSGVAIRPYKNGFGSEGCAVSDASFISETKKVVEDAVESRLLSDVPVGCFLSGGLDSSIVTTLAARRLDRLDTFTIGFEDLSDPYHGHADESHLAESYAKKLGTRHHTIKVTADTFLNLLDTFCLYADQPFAVSSGLGLLAIAKASKDAGIKVLLSGDGADEVFGGYSWYNYLPLKNREGVLCAAGGREVSFQNFGMDIDKRLDILSGYPSQKRAWAWHYYASENEKGQIFSKDIFCDALSSLRFFEQFKETGEWSEEDYVKQDRQFYLPNEMLKKVDRMTMAYSIEGRAPFVAPAILSHADKLRYNHLVRDGSLKWVLRMAFEDLLPSDIINRPKHGFNVPIDHWLKGDWSFLVDEAFSQGSALSRHGFINKESGAVARRMLFDEERLNGHTIFAFIMLNKWLETAG